MAALNETPSGNRLRISFFGLRNAGKSTLVNALTGQSLAIVSPVPGTTTDPVSKAMEILPLGPCLVTDTAGLDDDQGELGALRVAKTLRVLETTDVAVWVSESPRGAEPSAAEQAAYARFREVCRAQAVTVLDFHRGETADSLRRRLADLKLADETPGLLDGLVAAGDRVVCVCPIDASAPKGRLILPQVQLLRDALDRHAACVVCQPAELAACLQTELREPNRRVLVVTDSQAFGEVRDVLDAEPFAAAADRLRLTSFSVLFARQKGDLAAYARGLDAVRALRDGDMVLVAEGCTHHRQCNDIGTVKIPKALAKLAGGKKLNFVFASGASFDFEAARPALVVHCGGCMLTRREVLRRLGLARAAGVPVVNYGLVLAAACGVPLARVLP